MNKSSYASSLRKIEIERKEVMKELCRYFDSIYAPYEEKYPGIVACLKKAIRASDFFKSLELQNKTDEMIRKHGVQYLWELKI